MRTLEVDSVLLKGAQNQNVAGYVTMRGLTAGAKVFVDWPADSSAGAVQIEEAYETPGVNPESETHYPGTWSPIGAAFTSPSSARTQQVLAVAPSVFATVRARVTVTVNGATGVTVRIVAN